MNAKQRFDLSGKRALITGATQGIGRGIALALAQHGADIVVIDQTDEKNARDLAQQVEELGREFHFYQQDLEETGKLAELADRIWRDVGGLDILVNNAGTAYLERFNEITLEHWRRTLAVNLDAVFFLSQRVAEHMIAAGVKGRIINLSSKNGLVAEASLAHYNASKGGVELLTQSLAIELGPHGISVNAIAPGIIETQIAGEFEIDPAFFDYYKEHIPLEHRFGSVEEIAGAAVFLASAAGSYMTGQHLVIDGGVLCQQVPRMQFLAPYQNSIGRETH